MDKQMGRLIERKQTDVWVYGWTNGQTDKWMDWRSNRDTDGQTHRQTDRWMRGQTGSLTEELQAHLLLLTSIRLERKGTNTLAFCHEI